MERKTKKQERSFDRFFDIWQFFPKTLFQNWGPTHFISGSSRSFRGKSKSKGRQTGGWRRRKNGVTNTRTHWSGKAKISVLHCLDTNSIFNVSKKLIRQNRRSKSKVITKICILTGKIPLFSSQMAFPLYRSYGYRDLRRGHQRLCRALLRGWRCHGLWQTHTIPPNGPIFSCRRGLRLGQRRCWSLGNLQTSYS